MTLIRRSCTVCGAIAQPGTSRCAAHPIGTGRLPRSCAGCGVRSEANRCPACQEQLEEELRARQTWRRGYRTRAYKDARTEAIARANGRCEQCGRFAGNVCAKHDTLIRLETDHVIPLSEGGPNKATNLAVLCACCCHPAKSRADRRRRARA